MNDTLRRLLGLPEQASSVARDIDTLHLFVILTTLLGAACVGLVALWFAVRFRRRPGDQLTPRGASQSVVGGGSHQCADLPVRRLVVIGYRQYLRLQIPPIGAYEILVSAKQWMWSFAYPGGQRSLSMLVVPVGRPIKLVMMSRDVIHGFFVPAFRIKHDVVPG
jgi:cytochrome c oxidase subunit 2